MFLLVAQDSSNEFEFLIIFYFFDEEILFDWSVSVQRVVGTCPQLLKDLHLSIYFNHVRVLPSKLQLVVEKL